MRLGASSSRRTGARIVALAAALTALLAASAVTVAGGEYSTGDPAIPPGEEELIAAMLGRGRMVDQCTLASGSVQYTVIRATYNCLAGGEVSLVLGHPRNATVASVQTGQFAISVQSGSAPPGFQDAVASLVRSHEGSFQWSWPASDDAAAGADADEGAPE